MVLNKPYIGYDIALSILPILPMHAHEEQAIPISPGIREGSFAPLQDLLRLSSNNLNPMHTIDRESIGNQSAINEQPMGNQWTIGTQAMGNT